MAYQQQNHSFPALREQANGAGSSSSSAAAAAAIPPPPLPELPRALDKDVLEKAIDCGHDPRRDIPHKRYCRPLIISGASGVGKGTLLKMLFEEFPDDFGFCVSHTTRKPRPNEIHGVHYHFVSVEEFKKVEFLEWAEVHGNFYGTSLNALQDIRAQGRIPVLDIDIAGAKALRTFQDRLNSQFVWIDAPSLKEVEARLRGRGTETEAQIQRRLETMRQELAQMERHSNLYDVRILNDDLKECYKKLKKVLKDNMETSRRLQELRARGLLLNSNSAGSNHL